MSQFGPDYEGRPPVPQIRRTPITIFRLEATATANVVNVMAGSPSNEVGPSTIGATISGGGATLPVPYPNTVLARFGTISGGFNNLIDGSGSDSVIGGGNGNVILTIGD